MDFLLTIFHQSPLLIIIKRSISFLLELLKQPGSETREHNFVVIRERCHANIDKQECYWLTLMLLLLVVRSRSRDMSMFCIQKCKQPEMFISY